MIYAPETEWSNREAIDHNVTRPIEADDVDEPLDAVTGIAVAVIGGAVIWLVALFVLTQIF